MTPTASWCSPAWFPLPVGSLTFGSYMHLPAFSPPFLYLNPTGMSCEHTRLSRGPFFLICSAPCLASSFLHLVDAFTPSKTQADNICSVRVLWLLQTVNSNILLGLYPTISALSPLNHYVSIHLFRNWSSQPYSLTWQWTWVPQSHRLKMVHLSGLAVLLKDLGKIFIKTSRTMPRRMHFHMSCKDVFCFHREHFALFPHPSSSD